MAQFPAVVELMPDGIKIVEILGDQSPYESVAVADVNGDGFDDVIVGVTTKTGGGAQGPASYSSASYVVFGKASGFASEIALSSLDGTNGFKISENDSPVPTNRVATADVNGDGRADLIVSTGDEAGKAATYVVFGKASGFASDVGLSSLDGSDGFKLSWPNYNGVIIYNGTITSEPTNDINGDGFDDVIVGVTTKTGGGAQGPASYSFSSYVVFGKASGFASDVDLSSLDGADGYKIKIVEILGDQSPYEAVAVADINGDGFDDAIVSVTSKTGGGAGGPASYSFASYVVFGKASGFASEIDVSSLDGANGFKIAENDSPVPTNRVATADINGDGCADLIISTGDQAGKGATYVVFGKASGFAGEIDLSSLGGSDGFKLSNAIYNGTITSETSDSAGDINGDGFDDLIISLTTKTGGGAGGPASYSLASYVVFGKAAGFASAIDLSSLDGADGYKIKIVEILGDQSPYEAVAVADINGDGFNDTIVGVTTKTGGGAAGPVSYSFTGYVVFGKASGFAGEIDVSSLDGANGFKIAENDSPIPTNRVATADLNGDGRADLIISNGDQAGNAASYVVFGFAPDTAVDLTGSEASQTLAGGDFDDTLSGLGGNDKLYGHGGNDTINGGAGFDTAVFSGNRAAYTITHTGSNIMVSGPDGSDTLTSVERLQFADTTVLTHSVANDFNGDGRSDVLFVQSGVNFDSDYQWQMNDRAIGAQGGVDLFDKAFSVQVTGDFNGDSKADVLLENPATGGVWEWQLDGTGIAHQGAVDVGDPTYHILGTADLNGDGMSDVVWRSDTGLLYEWQMNGTSDTGAAIGTLDPTVWHAVGAGDFTGDGNADILFHYQNAANAADPANGAFDIWQMDGSAVVATLGVERPDPSWQILGVGDFNGDGISDIAIRNVSNTGDNGAVWVYLMAGTITTHPDTSKTADILSQGAVGIADAATWHVQEIGDLNGDGKDDILLRNDAGYFYSWDMNGTTIASEGAAGTEAGNWADPALHVVMQHWDVA